ncbi:hypothetical protein [Ferrovibrio sp.]|uniref:hypothetical protein n=1 Tax=Ferrovibrio sp. TaxID=1917215 RepID=UPI000CC5D274|nr:MAG: hypothetical protein CTR53_03220 [Ferrovibrio sp.]
MLQFPVVVGIDGGQRPARKHQSVVVAEDRRGDLIHRLYTAAAVEHDQTDTALCHRGIEEIEMPVARDHRAAQLEHGLEMRNHIAQAGNGIVIELAEAVAAIEYEVIEAVAVLGKDSGGEILMARRAQELVDELVAGLAFGRQHAAGCQHAAEIAFQHHDRTERAAHRIVFRQARRLFGFIGAAGNAQAIAARRALHGRNRGEARIVGKRKLAQKRRQILVIGRREIQSLQQRR